MKYRISLITRLTLWVHSTLSEALLSSSFNSFCSIILFPYFFLCLLACEKDVEKVCANSSDEHLQPFKEKMEGFVGAGEQSREKWDFFFFFCRRSHDIAN